MVGESGLRLKGVGSEGRSGSGPASWDPGGGLRTGSVCMTTSSGRVGEVHVLWDSARVVVVCVGVVFPLWFGLEKILESEPCGCVPGRGLKAGSVCSTTSAGRVGEVLVAVWTFVGVVVSWLAGVCPLWPGCVCCESLDCVCGMVGRPCRSK